MKNLNGSCTVFLSDLNPVSWAKLANFFPATPIFFLSVNVVALKQLLKIFSAAFITMVGEGKLLEQERSEIREVNMVVVYCLESSISFLSKRAAC